VARADLVGVYQLSATEQLITEQTELLYGASAPADAAAQIREQLASTVLVEVLISDADARFNIIDFAQQDARLPRENWQVAWAEAFLSADGTALLAERGETLPAGVENFRVAYFIHFYKPGEPLLCSYGSLPAPQPSRMPDRLAQLVPFELLD